MPHLKMQGNGKINIIIVTHNSEKDIEECLMSIYKQTYRNFDIIVVDNASSDKTLERARQFPNVKIISNPRNVGYSGGNNIGYENTDGDYITILNPDTIVDKNWLSELMKTLANNVKVGIVTPKVLMYDHKGIINTCGNDVHFTGLGFSRGINEQERYYDNPEYLFTPAGCSFVIKREVIEKVGFFDEDFFLRSEVPDLAWRTHLAGYKCKYVPTSKVFHKYSFKMNSFWYYVTERGRFLLMLKNYTYRSLVLIFLPLIVTEMLTWGYALLKGKEFVLSKVLAYKWIIRSRHKICRKRQSIHKIRRITDREIFRMLKWEIGQLDQLIDKSSAVWMTKMLNSLFRFFYAFLVRVI